MAVTLVTTPDRFALTKGGRMLYQFSGSGRFQTLGVLASCLLFVAAPVPEGTALTLTWKGQAHTIVFTTNPTQANEFTAGDGSAAWVTALLSELQGYYPLREDFTLSANDPTQLPGIVLTAKQPGPAYDITVMLPVGTPFGFGSTTFGADPLQRLQYSIYAEVWLQKVGTTGDDLSADYERIFTPMIECDAQGNALFDVGNVLHSALTPDWPVWNLSRTGGSAPGPARNSGRNYFICYGEAYGSPVAVGRIQTDQVRYAYLGGTDYSRRASGGVDLLATQTAYAEDDTALRFGDPTRFVRPDEPQYITFLNTRAPQVGTLLKIVRTFSNGNQDERLNFLEAQTYSTGQKVTYAVGPTQQDLFSGLPDGQTLTEYTVQRYDSDENDWFSIPYRYVINYDYQPYTRYFAYLNSLGAVETLATTGKGSAELNRFYEQAERYLTANYDTQDGQFVEYNVATQQAVEVTTGFRSEAELRGWNDFYRSAYRFQLVDGRALPIGIVSKSIKQAKDGDTLFAHKFQYTYLFKDDFYSEPIVPANALPPLGFVPGGSVVVQPTAILRTIDPTVPDVARTLTAALLNKFQQAFAWGNHALAGYLTQASGSALFRRSDQRVAYADLTDTPTTRDQAGLTDVPTRTDLFHLMNAQPSLSSWTGDTIPPEIR